MISAWLEPAVLFGAGALCFTIERLGVSTRVSTRERWLDVRTIGMAVLVSAIVAAIFGLVIQPVDGAVRIGRVAASIVAFDFFLYWLHRVCHGAWWPLHRRHHSAKHFEVSMAFRDSWAHLFIYAVALRGWGVLFTLNASELAIVSALFIAFQWWTHWGVAATLGVLDFVVIGPRHHSIHHQPKRELWSKNLGGLLCLWDQLFGTYVHPTSAVLLWEERALLKAQAGDHLLDAGE